MITIRDKKRHSPGVGKRAYAKIYDINLPGLRASLLLFSAFFLCLFIYSCIVPYSETTLAQGMVITAKGDIQVRAKVSGTIVALPIREGEYVKANQILFTLSQDYGGKEGSVMEYESQHYVDEAKRNTARVNSMTTSIANLKSNQVSQLAAIDAQIAAAKVKVIKARELVNNSEETFRSFKKMVSQGYVSKLEITQRENEVLNAQLNLKLEESAILQLQSNRTAMMDNTQYQIDDLSTQMLYLKNRNSEIERIMATQGNKSLSMLAPTDGYVVAINFPPGKAVRQDDEVVVVIRHDTRSPLEGYLYIPSTGAGRIKPGDKVNVRFDAWPVDKYGSLTSTLEAFYPVNIDPRSALIPLEQGQTYYLARVKLPASFTDPTHRRRLILGGMKIYADIHVDSRPLIILLIAPLERARQRFLT
ncbi:HlyD family secretion protein [Pantoea sp. 1.19]|uniref:HlyD family secretion protein n=1 Tax=Pantoea sp. 1.19 TaxID=1925589 RepID=UPI0011153D47|nr:HlyD family efflux transporter periplasmic adaptor subunit [Pantoea sp. 1.19]